MDLSLCIETGCNAGCGSHGELEESHMGEQLKRDGYLDFLKGLAVVLVVVGHCIQFGQGEAVLQGRTFFDDWAFRSIYSFHMPLFALISGWLFGASIERHGLSAQMLAHRCLSLVAPIVSFGVLSYMVQCLFGQAELGIKDLLSHVAYQLWFLYAMISCSVLVAALRTFAGDSLIAYVMACGLTIFAPLLLNLHEHAFVFPYFTGGYLMRSKMNLSIGGGLNRLSPFCLISTALWGLGMVFWNNDAFIYTSGMSVVDGGPIQVVIDCYRFLMGTLGCASCVGLARYGYDKLIAFPRFKGCLEQVGRKSLGIYCITSYLNPVLAIITTGACPSPLLVIAESVAILAIGYLASWILATNKVLSFCFLGGR